MPSRFRRAHGPPSPCSSHIGDEIMKFLAGKSFLAMKAIGDSAIIPIGSKSLIGS